MNSESRPGRGTHLPVLPDREASFSELRQWVSGAIGLPPTVRVDTVVRFGRGDEDALSITLSNGMTIRCDRQKRILSPGGLQAFFASESDGLCSPKYLTKAECGDSYIALCRLATATAEQDELGSLTERLESFVNLTEMMHMSLTPLYRYQTLRRIQDRPEYDRKAATEGKQGGQYTVRPVLVADHEWSSERGNTTYLLRHSEFITFLRVVHMLTIADNFLKGRMAEIGCEYHPLQAHGPRRRGHLSGTFYSLAPEMSVPHAND